MHLLGEGKLEKIEEDGEKSPAPGRIETHDFLITSHVLDHCATTVALRTYINTFIHSCMQAYLHAHININI